MGRKRGFAASKTVSNVRQFKKISEDKVKELQKERLKKRTFAKVQWAVKAFREWRSNRMSDVNTFVQEFTKVT